MEMTDSITSLKELLDAGVLSQKEYDAKLTSLLESYEEKRQTDAEDDGSSSPDPRDHLNATVTNTANNDTPLDSNAPDADTESVPRNEPQSSGATRKPRKVTIVILSIGGVAAIAAIIVGMLSASGAFLPSATRYAGKLPNLPAVMAKIDDWDKTTFEKEMSFDDERGGDISREINSLGAELGNGANIGLISDAFESDNGSILYDCWLIRAINEGDTTFSLLMSIQPTPVLTIFSNQYDIILASDSNLYLYTLNSEGEQQIVSIIDNFEECFQYLEKGCLTDGSIYDFDKSDAANLLSRCGVRPSDCEVLADRTYYKSINSAIDEIVEAKSGRCGTRYEYRVRTKDAAGKDLYLSVIATNAIDLSATKDNYGFDVVTAVGTQEVTIDASRKEQKDNGGRKGYDSLEGKKTSSDFRKTTNSSTGSNAGTDYYGNSSNNTPSSPNSSYVITDSDTKQYSKSELEKYSTHELFLARNEIYARHGRKFQNEELKAYFGSKSWYRGTIEPSDFLDSMLNAIERANANAIPEIEKERNSPYI